MDIEIIAEIKDGHLRGSIAMKELWIIMIDSLNLK